MRYTCSALEKILPPRFQSRKILRNLIKIIWLYLMVQSVTATTWWAEAGGWKAQSSPGQAGELAKVHCNGNKHLWSESQGGRVTALVLPPGCRPLTWMGGGFPAPGVVDSAHLPAPSLARAQTPGAPPPPQRLFLSQRDGPQRQDGDGAAGSPRWSRAVGQARVRD